MRDSIISSGPSSHRAVVHALQKTQPTLLKMQVHPISRLRWYTGPCKRAPSIFQDWTGETFLTLPLNHREVESCLGYWVRSLQQVIVATRVTCLMRTFQLIQAKQNKSS